MPDILLQRNDQIVQSYSISVIHVRSIKRYQITLLDDTILPISRKDYADVRQVLDNVLLI